MAYIEHLEQTANQILADAARSNLSMANSLILHIYHLLYLLAEVPRAPQLTKFERAEFYAR